MSEVKLCKQVGCEIKNDGKCLEGLDISECPHFYWEDEEGLDVIEEEDDKEEEIPATKMNVLFSGEELSLREICLVTNKYPSELVVILGDLDCGKTTLLATIFDLFQINDFKKYLFAGSLTQKGFEIRSHLSRVTSGGTIPETERTKTLEFRILHLAIKAVESSKLKHFLLSDISGETIKLARNSSSVMTEQLGIVKFADHVIYIIDGKNLETQNRTQTIFNTELFIQNAISNGIFSKETTLKILISKWDILSKDKKFSLEKVLIDRINSRFSKNLKSIVFSVIASRPSDDNSQFEMGYGIEELIGSLMEIKPIPNFQETIPNKSDRLFENFKNK